MVRKASRTRGIGEQLDAVFDALGAVFRLGPKLLGCLVLLLVADGVFRLLGDPAPVGRHHRQQLLADPLALGVIRQGLHAHGHVDARRRFGQGAVDPGGGQPGGGEAVAAGRIGLWNVGGDHGDVVAAREAVVPPVLEGRQAFVGILGGLLQGIAAWRKTPFAAQRQLSLEGRDRIAVADLFGLGGLAFVEQKQRDGELVAGVAELAGRWPGDPAQTKALGSRL
jgi:hypothetical protein